VPGEPTRPAYGTTVPTGAAYRGESACSIPVDPTTDSALPSAGRTSTSQQEPAKRETQADQEYQRRGESRQSGGNCRQPAAGSGALRSCSPAIQPSTKTYEEESCHSERDRHSQSVGHDEKHTEHGAAQGNRGYQDYERRWTRYETAGDAHADQATAADRFM